MCTYIYIYIHICSGPVDYLDATPRPLRSGGLCVAGPHRRRHEGGFLPAVIVTVPIVVVVIVRVIAMIIVIIMLMIQLIMIMVITVKVIVIVITILVIHSNKLQHDGS